MYKVKRDVSEMRKLDECGMENFGTLYSSAKTIAIVRDRWWPRMAKRDRDKISKKFPCNMWNKRNERPHVGGVSIRSRNCLLYTSDAADE